MAHDDRRSFLKWIINGLGAIFAVILGFPIISYIIDPRNRKAPPSDFRPVAGVKLSEVQDVPVQGVIRAVRHDAWTLHPNDVIGRVWVVRLDGKEEEKDAQKKYRVFTTVCPHLGCSINCNPDGHGFTCPCHDAKFDKTGTRMPNTEHYENAAPRGMDKLDFKAERDPSNPDENQDLLLVKYTNYLQGRPTPEERK